MTVLVESGPWWCTVTWYTGDTHSVPRSGHENPVADLAVRAAILVFGTVLDRFPPREMALA